MLSYFDFFVPLFILIQAATNFLRMFKLIADKGDLYYMYKQDWKEHLTGGVIAVLTLGFLIFLSKGQIKFSSWYIYERYFTSPDQLFDFDFWYDLRIYLKENNPTDYDALASLRSTLRFFPVLFTLLMKMLSDMAPKILGAGIYGNGIFDGKLFYTYDDIKSYEVVTEDDKTTLTLTLVKKGLFTQNHKTVDIPVMQDEVNELVRYLRHEIRDTSAFEENVQAIR
jgi:hypothetical protein